MQKDMVVRGIRYPDTALQNPNCLIIASTVQQKIAVRQIYRHSRCRRCSPRRAKSIHIILLGLDVVTLIMKNITIQSIDLSLV